MSNLTPEIGMGAHTSPSPNRCAGYVVIGVGVDTVTLEMLSALPHTQNLASRQNGVTVWQYHYAEEEYDQFRSKFCTVAHLDKETGEYHLYVGMKVSFGKAVYSSSIHFPSSEDPFTENSWERPAEPEVHGRSAALRKVAEKIALRAISWQEDDTIDEMVEQCFADQWIGGEDTNSLTSEDYKAMELQREQECAYVKELLAKAVITFPQS